MEEMIPKETITSELTGAALDWAVAKCEGGCTLTDPAKLQAYLESLNCDDLWNVLCANTPGAIDASVMSDAEMIAYGVRTWRVPHYSTDWSQGGPIIERHIFRLEDQDSDGGAPDRWLADGAGVVLCGPTPLIAAMRCYVASKLGDTVEVPGVLL